MPEIHDMWSTIGETGSKMEMDTFRQDPIAEYMLMSTSQPEMNLLERAREINPELLDGLVAEVEQAKTGLDLSSDIGQAAFERSLRQLYYPCLLYTSPSPRDRQKSRMPSSA